MLSKIKKLIFFLILSLMAYSYLLPAMLEQKQKEWQENGMSSILESLDPDDDQQNEGNATHDEP